MKCSLYSLVLLTSLSDLSGQVSSTTEGNRPKPEFEVASVRVNKTGTAGHRLEANIVAWKSEHNPFRFRAINTTLQMLACNAFGVQPFQLIDRPDWFDSNAYDVEAESGRPSTLDQQMLMLQALLADRFQLKVHFEDRLREVYFLTLGNSGTKVREIKEPDNRPSAAPTRGSVLWMGTADSFAQYLSFQFSSPLFAGSQGLPVVDRTGLRGTYDFGFHMPDSHDKDQWEGLRSAVESQLGLQLKRNKAPMRILVIDHVDAQPSEN